MKQNSPNININHLKGMLFAIFAALSNSSIGIFNKFGLSSGLSSEELAFYKTIGAFILLSIFLLTNTNGRQAILNSSKNKTKIAFLSFLGVFILYHFETLAFSLSPVPIVSFLTYAAGVLTLILGVMFLNEQKTVKKAISVIIMIMGVYLIFETEISSFGSIRGASYALIGGVGYALFIFFCRYYRVSSGLGFLWWMFGFGTLFLSVPYLINNEFNLSLDSIPYIIALILIPTIGGFFFTVKATQYIEAGKVQMIETTDPVFASLFSFFILSEIIPLSSWIGCILVFMSILLVNINDVKIHKRKGDFNYV